MRNLAEQISKQRSKVVHGFREVSENANSVTYKVKGPLGSTCVTAVDDVFTFEQTIKALPCGNVDLKGAYDKAMEKWLPSKE